MTYKTILVGPLFSSSAEEKAPSDALVRYAVDFAASQGAHLSIAIGCIRLSAPAAIMVREARALISKANEERRAEAQTFGNEMMARATAAGVTSNLDIMQDEYGRLATHVGLLARLADISIMEADAGSVSLHEGILEQVLFDSGRPIIIVPPDWSGAAKPGKVVVSWDGSAKAARALGDAMPVLAHANEVEIVSISGDPDASKRVDGADIAAHVARHCRNVTVTSLPAQGGDIGATLASHAKLTRADLVVMGAFARTKLRQLILGGVTSSMISNPPCPVLMSY
ncbi:MAG: universal stress protein [Beijerinckiaceae bacterium]|nr:universal stress protein [Beijerinckiaceae bacterium]